MSRKNKVNPDHYKVAGRLSPDDLARERIIQSAPQIARAWDSRPGQPAWMDNRSAGPGDESEAGPRAKRLPAGARRVTKRRQGKSEEASRGYEEEACLQAVTRREADAERSDGQAQDGICREAENNPQGAPTGATALRP